MLSGSMKNLLIFCLFALAPATLAQADLKIAVIDLSKAFDQYYVTKEAQTKLTQRNQEYQKEFQDMVSDYDHMSQDVETLGKATEDPTLAPSAKADKQKAFDEKKQELFTEKNKLEEREKELQKELNDEVLRRHKEILDQIKQVIDAYSGPAGYDLVIDTSSVSPTSGVSIIMFKSSKLIDITSDIVTKLNASAPATTAGTAPSTAPSGISNP